MVLQEGIPGRKINIIITKDGYVPLKKTIFVPFLYTKEKEALKHPTVFTFDLRHDYERCYHDVCMHYALLIYVPVPIEYHFFPGRFWYPPPPGGYLPRPGHHHPGNCSPHPPGPPHHGNNPPPHPPGGGTGHGSGGENTPPIPPAGSYSGNGTVGHNGPPAGQGYGHNHAGYTPEPPSGKETIIKPDSLDKVTIAKSVSQTSSYNKKETPQDKDKKMEDNSATKIYHRVQTIQKSYRK